MRYTVPSFPSSRVHRNIRLFRTGDRRRTYCYRNHLFCKTRLREQYHQLWVLNQVQFAHGYCNAGQQEAHPGNRVKHVAIESCSNTNKEVVESVGKKHPEPEFRTGSPAGKIGVIFESGINGFLEFYLNISSVRCKLIGNFLSQL